MKKLLLSGFAVLLVGAGCLGGSEDLSLSAYEEEIEENVVIYSPAADDSVESPLIVSGKARVFEGALEYRLRTYEGEVLDVGSFQIDADVGEHGEFEEQIFLPEMHVSQFYLEVFSYSAATGDEEDMVELSLQLKDDGLSVVNVFFADLSTDGDDGCNELDFEKRTMHITESTAALAITELIKGPVSDWAITSVPELTELNFVDIENGIARVDFVSKNPARWSGDFCHIRTLRSQIEETLLQFPTVDQVEITVNGDMHNILIP